MYTKAKQYLLLPENILQSSDAITNSFFSLENFHLQSIRVAYIIFSFFSLICLSNFFKIIVCGFTKKKKKTIATFLAKLWEICICNSHCYCNLISSLYSYFVSFSSKESLICNAFELICNISIAYVRYLPPIQRRYLLPIQSIKRNAFSTRLSCISRSLRVVFFFGLLFANFS